LTNPKDTSVDYLRKIQSHLEK